MQAKDGIRGPLWSRGLGDVDKIQNQYYNYKYNHKRFFIQKTHLLFIGFIDEHFKLMKHTEYYDECKNVATHMTNGFNISKF